MRILRTVSFRVLLGTLAILLISFALLSYLIVGFYTARLEEQAVQSAYRVTDYIVASTRNSMLLNRKQDVYDVLRAIGHEPGVTGIRIYNKRGQITYSTEPGEAGTMVDLHAEACFACHDRASPLEAVPSKSRTRIFRSPDGHRAVGVITPVRNERACSAGGCHRSPAERTVLGVFDVRMSLDHVDHAITQARRRTMGWAAIGFLAVATVSFAFLHYTVRRPIRALTEGTRQLAAGNLEYQIQVRSDDDLGRLARSFNDMARSLEEAHEENRTWSLTLEQRVREKTDQLRRANQQLLQVEKMASLGTLAASVAHELNNPLSGILTYARLDRKRIRREGAATPLLQQMDADLEMIGREAERCGNIVRNLLLFSRKQQGEFHRVALREIVDRATRLMAHHMQMANIAVTASVEPEDLSVVGDEGQLEQALVALLMNGAEAMPDGGPLAIRAFRLPSGEAGLEIADAGSGIAPEDLPHVFEPFFTTKPRGQGVGLGLAVVYGIVQRHQASIDVRSEPGRGTTFAITFPPPDRAAERRSPTAGEPERS